MLEKKVAIVTGASRGLGRAIAEKFAVNGANLVLVALHEDGLRNVADVISQLGGSASILAGDIAIPETSQLAFQMALDNHGGVDILVNNVGTISREPVEELSVDSWQRVIDANLNGTFHMSRAVLPYMREQARGKIINMSSQMAKIPHPSAAPSYEVSKSGVVALTRHLAYHYARFNICVNAIAPGSIDTDLPKSMTPAQRQKLKDAVPMRRLGDPEEVADCAFFLASTMSDYLTGEVIDINGGTVMD